MDIDNIISILIWIVLFIYFLKTIFTKNEGKDLPTMLILSGLGIFSSEIDFLMNYINPDVNVTEVTNNLLYIIGLILVILGIVMNYFEKKQHHVFNLLGENNKKELIDDDFKVKNIRNGVIYERSIDFMVVVELQKMNNETNELVNKLISKEARIINNYPFRDNIYLTSMASIPYTVLFGTYLEDKSNIKYLNYNRFNSEFELLPNKVKKKKSLKINVEEDFCESKTNDSSEILVSISGTFKVHESDLIDFNLSNRMKISMNVIDENNISSQQEVTNIANEIVNSLINISKEFDTIHVAAAIPGMLALEIGRVIKNRSNQLEKIVFYHYIAQSKPRYKYGIVVNGENKGKLKERSSYVRFV